MPIDADLLKTAITAVSAFVSAASAVVAFRSVRLARADVFSNAREALLLVMADNKLQAQTLSLRAKLLLIELTGKIQEGKFSPNEQLAILMENLSTGFEPKILLGEDPVTMDEIEALPQSQESLRFIRDLTTKNRLLHKHMTETGLEYILKGYERITKGEA